MISLPVEDIDLYYASEDDFETVGCFLHFHKIGELPMNIHHPI